MAARSLATALVLIGLAAPAAAQATADLTGTWVEVSGGVVRRGQLDHQPSTGAETVFGGPLIFTLTVERQEGNVFSGAWASRNRTDPLVGALSANGRTLYLADDNGTMQGELRSPDQLEICRALSDADTMLAMCRTFERRR